MTNVLIKSVEKIKTQILYSITIFRRWYRLRYNVEKHGGAREIADDNMAVLCMLD
jgi:hypothetical protein